MKYVLIFVVAFVLAVATYPITIELASATTQSSIGILERVERGQVRVQRSSWDGFRVVSIGEPLLRNDIIFPTQGTEAVVRCTNGNVWRVPDGIASGVTNTCSPQNRRPSSQRTCSGFINGIICGLSGSPSQRLPAPAGAR